MVGKLVFAFSRLDANLALLAASKEDPDSRANTIAKLKNTSFKHKLAWVIPVLRKAYPNDAQCLAEWQRWLASAEALRALRNDMVHGRWGVNDMERTINNVVGIPGSPNQREIVYTLKELEAKVGEAIRVAQEFGRLRQKWPA